MIYRPTRVKFVLIVANSLLWVSQYLHYRFIDCIECCVGLMVYGLLLWVEHLFHNTWDVLLAGAQTDRDDLPHMRTRALAIALLAIGAANFAIGVCRCCGAWPESRPFLALNIFFLALSSVFVLSTGVTAICDTLRLSPAHGTLFERSFTTAVVKNVRARWPSPNASDVRSKTMRFFNKFQYFMGCCGSHNWIDFFNYSLYESEASTGSQPMSARVPLSCCMPAIGKSTYAAPGGRGGMAALSGEPWLSLTPANRAGCCDGSESSSTGRYSQGCLVPAYDLIMWNLRILSLTTIIYGLYQVFCVVQAIIMWCAIDTDILEE